MSDIPTKEQSIQALNDDWLLCSNNNIHYCPEIKRFIKLYETTSDGIICGDFSGYINDSITCIIRDLYPHSFLKELVKIDDIMMLDEISECHASGIPQWGLPNDYILKIKGYDGLQLGMWKIVNDYKNRFRIRSLECVERIDTDKSLILMNLLESLGRELGFK